ncbi:helix-turn-helix domain-containing protein [Rhodobacterales bacterium]|nr:helix-turn-helix domain-containing protein [Rhodobacterales bacterium]
MQRRVSTVNSVAHNHARTHLNISENVKNDLTIGNTAYSGIPSLSVEIPNISGPEQFESFARAFSPFAKVRPPKGASYEDGFEAYLKGYNLGQVRVTLAQVQECNLVRSSQDVIRLGLEDWILWLSLRGRARIDLNGIPRQIDDHQRLTLISSEQPFTAHCANHDFAYFFIPRHLLPGLEGVMDSIADGPHGAIKFHPFLVDYLDALVGMLPRMTVKEAKLAEETTINMMRAAVLSDKNHGSASCSPIMATRFELAKQFIDANLTSPDLSVDVVQRALRVSRRQLYKIFETRGGVNRYIRMRRLQACHRALLENVDARPIYQIAESFGFADPANFSKLFRAEFGVNARDVSKGSTRTRGAQTYSEWLRGR